MPNRKQQQRYRALRGLNFQTDPAIIRRHSLGDVRPGDHAHSRRVEAGEVVDDIPPHAVASYLRRGCIVETDEPLTAAPPSAPPSEPAEADQAAAAPAMPPPAPSEPVDVGPVEPDAEVAP